MASEIRVDKINSLSGVGTVTLSPTGVDISGITTAATLKATTGIVTTLTATTGIVTTLTTNTTRATTGIVTTLTATTGIVTTLTTNTLTANSTAKVGSGVTLSSDGDVFVTGVTTSSTVKVGGGVTISESGIEASGIGITCANINGTQIGGRRNIIINGAMNVAQRDTSSTSTGHATVDRFGLSTSSIDEDPTQAQVDVSSGTTPYTLGFRKAYKITNGNQTGGAGTGDRIVIYSDYEAQDIANSGWNYTSTSSFITLSFWVKSSVAQNFYFRLQTTDGTAQNYVMETGSLSADTWTKIEKTIPGNSNLQFDNNVNQGLSILWSMFRGTDTTGSMSLNAWAAYSSSTRTPDNTSTWYTTNDATFELTGIQLEVGSQATAFEHRSFGEELVLCERYFQNICKGANYIMNCMFYNTSIVTGIVQFKTPMRTTPSLYQHTTTDGYLVYRNNSQETFTNFTGITGPHVDGTGIYRSGLSGTAGHAGGFHGGQTSSHLAVQAEL